MEHKLSSFSNRIHIQLLGSSHQWITLGTLIRCTFSVAYSCFWYSVCFIYMELLSDWGFHVIVYLYVCFRYIPHPSSGVARSTEYRGKYSQRAFLKCQSAWKFSFFFSLLFLIRAFLLPCQTSSVILTDLFGFCR